MAVLAIGYIYDVAPTRDGLSYDVYVNVVAGMDRHNNLRAGTFLYTALPALVNDALAQFVKDYAAANMGVIFGVLDTATLVTQTSLSTSK